jgi:hypothetical protein
MVKATEPHRPDRDTIGGSTGCRDYPMSTDVTMPLPGILILARCTFVTSRICSGCSCQVFIQSARMYRQSVQAARANN